MNIENFKIKHVNKGDIVIEGSFEFSGDFTDDVKSEILSLINNNLDEGERYDVHTSNGIDRLYFDDEGETLQLKLTVQHLFEDSFNYNVEVV